MANAILADAIFSGGARKTAWIEISNSAAVASIGGYGD
jgi:hypothetical protein